jgi:hypothetical protein
MTSIIIGFSRSRSPYKIGSKLIQWSENRPFSHAYFRYTCPLSGKQIINQASHGYVNEMEYEIFKKDNIIVEEYQLTCKEEEYKELMTFLRSNLGRKYSQKQIFVIGCMKVLGIKKNIYVDGDKADICSEWVAKGAKLISYISQLPSILDTYTPSDLREYVWTQYNREKGNIHLIYSLMTPITQ